jgi:hypothetical protein
LQRSACACEAFSQKTQRDEWIIAKAAPSPLMELLGSDGCAVAAHCCQEGDPELLPPIAMRTAYLAIAIWCFAAAITFSEVKPNFFCNSLSGAEAPNVSMPIL